METAQKRSFVSKNSLAIILDTDEGTVYCCVECPAKYSDKEKLEVHLCSHYDEYRFLCGICGTGLKRKEHLDRHILGHQEVRPHVCPECGKGFKRKEHLNIHRSIHSGDKSQVCPLCHRSFYRKDHLQKHLQTHTKMFIEQRMATLNDQEVMEMKQEVLDDEDIKPIIGDEGDITMKIDEENKVAQQPIFIRSSDPQRPFECIVCHKTYKRKDHLKLHNLTHVEKDKICSECGKAFHKEEQLLFHMNVHLFSFPALGQEQQFRVAENAMVDHCDIDIMPLDSSELLVPRASFSSETESRPHECNVCHRRFKRKQHLKAHANVHLKNQPPTIWCSLCNEGFVSNSQFESHQCLHHVNGGEVQPTDDIDVQPTDDIDDIHESNDAHDSHDAHDTHDAGDNTDTEHSTAPQDNKKENNLPIEFVPIPIVNCMDAPPLPEEAHIPTPVKVYVCKFCQKPFRRKDHYKIHLHIHTGVKSFFCPDCGKGFYRKDHLQKHMAIHVRHKPERSEAKAKKALPALFPINLLKDKMDAIAKSAAEPSAKPEITITAPANTKLRVPLQIKVPYQMVIATHPPPRTPHAPHAPHADT